MATKSNITSISLVAAADLSAKQYHVVKVDNTGKAAVSGASDLNSIGVLQGKSIAGEAATVAVYGVTKAAAGGNITAGAAVTSDANGKVVTAGAGKQIIGHALVGGASGDVISVLLGTRGIVPAT